MWFYIIFGVVGALITLVLHELSHACVVWLTHGKLTSFYVWPHKHNGRFYFGRITYVHETPYVMNRKLSALAPLLKALFFFVGWGVAGIFWHPLWCLAFWEATDWINWLQGWIRRSKNDGGTYRAL